MKKIKHAPLIFVLSLLLALAVCVCGIIFSGTSEAEAASSGSGTYISAYDINYEIRSNRSMTVTETVTVNFDNNSYFTRYIPANAGEMIKNVKVLEKPNTDTADIYASGDYLVIDIGGNKKYGEIAYSYSYDYCLTRAQEGATMLALTPIGSAFECAIENITLSFTLPDGYISTECFWQNDTSYGTINYTASETDGGTYVEAALSSIEANTEVRVDFTFEKGALSVYFDFSSYIFAGVALIVLLVLIVLRLLCFNKSSLTPVINIEAPDKMDPLMMGKLIDNKVNSEDITSMLFYWADKGYIKIVFEDKDDPTLIRIMRDLPSTAQDYERMMYNNLFKGNDVVKTSSLENKFYATSNAVIKQVDAKTKNTLFTGKSITVSIAFMLAGGLIAGLAPLLLGMITVNYLVTYYYGLLAVLAGAGIYFLAEIISYNRLKNSTAKTVLCSVGVGVLCALCCAIYFFLVPSFIISQVPKIMISVLCFIIIPLSVCLINRTPDYVAKLNDIVGFRNYILYAEKDKLEAMLEEDPQFYYHILPYAQVLNVSDIWENKFKSLTVAPPSWTTTTTGDILDFVICCSIIRNMRVRTTHAMISRPSSSSVGSGGRSGGGHGSFGGFGGGGHGGGGISFR